MKTKYTETTLKEFRFLLPQAKFGVIHLVLFLIFLPSVEFEPCILNLLLKKSRTQYLSMKLSVKQGQQHDTSWYFFDLTSMYCFLSSWIGIHPLTVPSLLSRAKWACHPSFPGVSKTDAADNWLSLISPLSMPRGLLQPSTGPVKKHWWFQEVLSAKQQFASACNRYLCNLILISSITLFS